MLNSGPFQTSSTTEGVAALKSIIQNKCYETSYSSYGRGLSPARDSEVIIPSIKFDGGPFRSVYMSDFHEFSARQLKGSSLKNLVCNRNMDDHMKPVDFRSSEESTSHADFKGRKIIGATRLHVVDPPRPPFAYIDALVVSGATQYSSDCGDMVGSHRTLSESRNRKTCKDTFSGCQGGVPRDPTRRRRRRRHTKPLSD